MLNIIFLCLAAFLLFNFIKAACKHEKPVKKAVLSMLTGGGSLAAVSFVGGLFGLSIAVNIYTVFIALTLGIPGVVLLLLKLFLI
ncbi:MAG: pro-sigmaK processing inhibitor BofA family protein [Oscillospiraceae bacterium]|jgi:pro-sigmaK processing inhibitor BofA|nr:pro-sigmaK processing inhibitor BofA family protein [Oscillospiraceae bacterium]